MPYLVQPAKKLPNKIMYFTGSDNISKSQNITKPVEKAAKKDQTLFEEDAYKG